MTMTQGTSKEKQAVIAHAELLFTRASETLKGARKQLDDNTAAGALARGHVFELVGYFPQAIECYKAALAIDPELEEAAARLSISQLKAGQFKNSLASAMSLAARNPEFQIRALATNEQVSAMTILGDALVTNDRLNDAIEAYQAARRIAAGAGGAGEDSYAAGRLAQIYLALGEPQKALELAPAYADNPRFHDLSSVMTLGRTSGALLPGIERASLASIVMAADVGRPLMIDHESRLAPLVQGDQSWCAD